MRATRTAAIALAGATLFGALTIASATPDKKPKKPAKPAVSTAAGKKIYDANGCAACHVVAGKGGKTGPELTHIGKSVKPDKLAAVIRDSKKLDPKSTMPPYPVDKIDAKQLKALVAYLQSLK